jgi:hypothetical protein
MRGYGLNHEGLPISRVVCYITCYFSDFPGDKIHYKCLSHCRYTTEVSLHSNACKKEQRQDLDCVLTPPFTDASFRTYSSAGII